MNCTKLLLSLFFAMMLTSSLCANGGNASYLDMIELVKNKEDYLQFLQQESSRLWDRCIQTIEIYRDSTCVRYYTSVKPFIPFDDVIRLYEFRQKLKTFGQDFQFEIAQADVDLNNIDGQGNSILQYAQSRSVYNSLRAQGANFELDSFVRIHKLEIALAAIPCIATIACLYVTGYLSYDIYVDASDQVKSKVMKVMHDCKDFFSNIDNQNIVNPLSLQDDNGRTSIMNYLIKQEAKIKEMSSIKNTYKNYWDYADYKFQEESRLALIKETKIEIQSMIELGAVLDVKDFDGKTISDYCKTEEIYEILRKARAPFKAFPLVHTVVLGYVVLLSSIPLILAIASYGHLVSEANWFDDGMKKILRD